MFLRFNLRNENSIANIKIIYGEKQNGLTMATDWSNTYMAIIKENERLITCSKIVNSQTIRKAQTLAFRNLFNVTNHLVSIHRIEQRQCDDLVSAAC